MDDFTGKTTEVDYTKDPNIDVKDRKILTVLSRNCRFTPSQIGKQVGLSKEVVSYRIKKLEQKNIIRGYITILNPAKMGLQIFIVYLETQNMSKTNEEEFIQAVLKHPSTHYIVQSIGKYEFVFDIFAPTIREFDRVLHEILKEFGNFMKNYEVTPVLDVLKYVHLTESLLQNIQLNPIKYMSDTSFMKDLLQHGKIDYTPIQTKLDDTDKGILSALANNAKLQLKQVAKKVHVSDDTVKYRIRKLIKENIILGFLPIINISKLGYHNYGIQIELTNISYQEKDKLSLYLAAHPDVSFCIRTSGQYELIVNISVRDNLHLHQFMTDLKQKFPKQIKTIEIFLILKDYKMAFYS